MRGDPFCLSFLFQEGGGGIAVRSPASSPHFRFLFTHLTGAPALLSLLRTRHLQPLEERRAVVPPFPPWLKPQEDVGLASALEPARLPGTLQDGPMRCLPLSGRCLLEQNPVFHTN